MLVACIPWFGAQFGQEHAEKKLGGPALLNTWNPETEVVKTSEMQSLWREEHPFTSYFDVNN